MANAYFGTKSMKNGILILIDEKISLAYSINIKKSMKNGNHKKRRSPLMIHAKTKFPDRALSCVITLFCHMIALLYCRGEGRGQSLK